VLLGELPRLPTAGSGAPPLVPHALEERVAEHAVPLGRPVEIIDACIERRRLYETRGNRGLANTLDHRGERLPLILEALILPRALDT